jgi:hypothetical protein
MHNNLSNIKQRFKDSPFQQHNINSNDAKITQSSTKLNHNDIINEASNHMSTYIDPSKNNSINNINDSYNEMPQQNQEDKGDIAHALATICRTRNPDGSIPDQAKEAIKN